ncbi:two-component regulator propeller domain-containing protein [Flavobacterium sp. SUN052]|uniref:type IX secretion system anionic LPS delivery protein PorZ n=1 Tax=Flavobacterium sp. SUN052 TaxID=3002441 RepID=UPI00237E51BF|nr:two-component regulator propeller domain-containing protein [Flavobacterium sp. SUN052]MEC4004272.1 two-component regulator propeller domain-containing protein [Flavobacterium sp. SUN052]
MRKIFLTLLLFFSLAVGFAQSNQLWKGYFSFSQITDLSESSQNIYASSENAFFSKNLSTNDIKTTTSVDGLKAETITSLYHSDTVNKTFVGNQNGLLLVVNQDGSILYKTGILDEVPVSPVIKRINHFLEFNNKLYISCDYGITVFDLITYEFGDTYYIGNGGQQVKIYQTTILNNEIYAATETNGIKKALLSNPNLVDYNQWQVFDNGNWNGITTIQNKLIALNTNGRVYKHNGVSFDEILNLSQSGLDIRTSNDYLIVTSLNNVYLLNSSFQQVAHVTTSQVTTIPVTFSCATLINGIIYIGTNENGVLSSSLSNPTNFEFIMPDGPLKNKIFRVKTSSSMLLALYGRYSGDYNPYDIPNGLGQYPISKYTSENGWDLIPYSSLFGAKSLSNITFNPKNEKQFYVSSYFSGLLKVDNEVPTILYNSTNTGTDGLQSLTLSPPNPTYVDIRINGPLFDKNGNVWVTNNYLTKPLKVLRASGQWQSFDLTSGIAASDLTNLSYAVPTIDKNSTKWLPTDKNGLIGFNENYSNKIIVIKTGTNGNLPDLDVRCVAVDNKNQLWIGTNKGLRIIPSVDSFISETEIQTKAIIILENDLAQELFYDQFILDIAVDGANRKWVSISDSGVYLVSSNGQETIYHFTKDNSPLPSNIINDIEIDGVTGEVFFATDKGLVSFKGTSTKPSDDLSGVYVYPNPMRPEYNGTVKISALTNKAVVKITDIEGNLVYETTSEGGTIEWDTTAFGKYKVASGVYMILVSAQDGIDTIVKKVMIIR